MNSLPAALTWELFARGRWALLAAALGSLALPIVLFGALEREGSLDVDDPSMIVMHLTMAQLNVATFGGILIANGWNLSRLYPMPVTSTALVAWRLLPAMAIMAAETIAWTAVLNAVFRFDWPLWGPALFAAVALAAVQAAVWITQRSRWIILVLIILGVVLGLWIDARSGHTFVDPSSRFVRLGPAEVFSLLGVAAISYGVAVIGVARNRRGERPFSLGVVAWLERLLARDPGTEPSFRTAAHAQFAYAWRNGGVMPAMVAATLAFCFMVWLLKIYGAHGPDVTIGVGELVEAAWSYSWFLMVVAVVGGLTMGNFGGSGDTAMGQFLATRPMTNPALGQAMLCAAAKSLVVAWLVWAVAIALLYAALLAVGAMPEHPFPPTIDWRELPASILGSWIILGVVASAQLTGRPRPFALLIAVASVAYIGIALASKYLLSQDMHEQVMVGVIICAGVACLVAGLAAFIAARRNGLIEAATVWAALAAWATLVIVGVLLLRPMGPIPLTGHALLFGGLLALAVMPLAAAPLALTWNRHR